MKTVCVLCSLIFTILLGVGCVAEVMGAPSEALPASMIVDRVMFFVCLLLCVAALKYPGVASIVGWVVLLAFSMMQLHLEGKEEVLRGVLKFAVGAVGSLNASYVFSSEKVKRP